MVVVVEESQVNDAIRILTDAGERAWRLGRIVAGDRTTQYV